MKSEFEEFGGCYSPSKRVKHSTNNTFLFIRMFNMLPSFLFNDITLQTSLIALFLKIETCMYCIAVKVNHSHYYGNTSLSCFCRTKYKNYMGLENLFCLTLMNDDKCFTERYEG